jgi:hypothetical protein
MAKNNSKLIDKVCQLGQTCYCNPSFGQKLSQIFITVSIILLILTVTVYLVYLNRKKIAIFLSPKLYYDCHGKLYENNNQDKNVSQ